MSTQIELRHLRYFKAVAEELHFRKAAERLFITQPGLSRQIKQLETEMGVDLFIRTKRTVALTETGAYLLGEVDFILNHLDHVLRSAALIANGEEGELRVGFVGSAMHDFLPGLLKTLNEDFPGISTSLEQLSNRKQIDAIEDNHLDIGFIRTQSVPLGFNRLKVKEDTFSLVVPKDHFLTQKNYVSVKQLEHEDFIFFSRNYSYDYFELIISIFQDQGFTPKVINRSVDLNTIFRLVENKMGLAIVPSVLKMGFDLDIRFIELKNIPQRTILSAVWKESNRNPVLPKFLDLVKARQGVD